MYLFFAGPVKRSSRMVREVYPEIEPEKEGNLAEGTYADCISLFTIKK